MKNLFNVTIGLLLSICFITSCTNNDDAINKMTDLESKNLSDEKSEQFFKENIAIFDARIRTIDENTFVREVYLKNFSSEPWDKTSIGFTGYLFEDNGKGNDIIANDGLYTSVEMFVFDDKFEFNEDIDILSIMEKPIITSDFIQTKALQKFSNGYSERTQKLKAGGTATITCDVKVVSTGCIADWIWDGFGCIEFSNCSVTIGW
ncbi:hypothetical protein [Carboxylicivirga sp. M1479]|uniref:hypothetical protein n=1 Tax=Carboxylicivirga sp. M1479 TaxID=2594476 RepID=UPI0011782F95|nr:hypothetical protein [Carboxylicivirga sp. M1479]TRX71021.1 hypothetical protein FNN09_08395 [Carboxylicivirga sp. M1479]